jgi:hypothetical protein
MGGAAGHMRHPFDLESVQSGNDLIGLFESLKSYAQEAAQNINVKIDGVNVSFKLAGNEFAVDRGSSKPIDVEGVTLARVGERFGEGHGMRPAITNLLSILNAALPNIQREINILGLNSNPHYFLNTEYVLGTTNATSYNNNFIAIHGVNAFYAKYRNPTKAMLKKDARAKPRLLRPGLPGGGKGKNSVEVSYDQSAMTSLINKLKPYAAERGFDVYGPVPTALKQGGQIDYSQALNTPFEVNISDEYSDMYGQFEHLQGRPIKDWLSEISEKPGSYISPTYDKTYRTTDGKRINPYHKNTYLRILEKAEPVDSYIVADETGDDVRPMIDSAVMVHATRLLGNAFLSGLTSDIGDMVSDSASHEGVVIRDPRFSQYPFKITGEFIVAGMYGVIAQKMSGQVTENAIRKMVRESITRTYFSMLPRKR